MWVVNFGLEGSAKYTHNWHKNVKKKRYMMNLFSIYFNPLKESKRWLMFVSDINMVLTYIFITIINFQWFTKVLQFIAIIEPYVI